MFRFATNDDEWNEVWDAGDYLRAMALGPLTGALWFGPDLELLAGYLGGYERRFTSRSPIPFSDLVEKIWQISNDDDVRAYKGHLSQSVEIVSSFRGEQD